MQLQLWNILLADYIYNLISVAISLKQLPVPDCDSLTSASVQVHVHYMCLYSEGIQSMHILNHYVHACTLFSYIYVARQANSHHTCR